jgi:hypothetical protein
MSRAALLTGTALSTCSTPFLMKQTSPDSASILATTLIQHVQANNDVLELVCGCSFPMSAATLKDIQMLYGPNEVLEQCERIFVAHDCDNKP